MDIRGLQKLSLLDFPGQVACTVFTGGCNLRCPFCHNPGLVLPERLQSEPSALSMTELFQFLEKRRGVLDGVCLTGGEPLMQPDLEAVVLHIHEMGYRIKLDTNGTYPDRLAHLLETGAVDYVAMDVKNAFERYPETVGIPGFSTKGVEESVRLLLEGRVPYEFRTTVVREFHHEQEMVSLAKSLSGAHAFFLQRFVDSGDLLAGSMAEAASGVTSNVASVATSDRLLTGCDADEMAALLAVVKRWVPAAETRGV